MGTQSRQEGQILKRAIGTQFNFVKVFFLLWMEFFLLLFINPSEISVLKISSNLAFASMIR